ncbi:MAG: EVE domain-containing protein [Candidatus Cloacimonetes bacterium]|jgi:predicted RNA-binding protein with PUA-like domain|nr:EVE domain-containing protein [Candidatus Cloacimonadota bacterium]
MSAYWAFLADPASYGWDDLVRETRAVWDGVRNAAAQRNMQRCEKGDEVLIYHTAPDKAAIGIARVVRTAYPDPNNDKLVVVDIEPVRPLERPIPLAEMKADDVLKDMSFVRMPRVAVQPITAQQWKRILKLGG